MSELYYLIEELLQKGKVAEAITLLEDKARSINAIDMNTILGRDMIGMHQELAEYIENYMNETEEDIEAIYLEANGLMDNLDQWFLNLFAFDTYEGLDDLDWLSDPIEELFTDLPIIGYEAFQQQMLDKPNVLNEEEKEILELLMIARLNELLIAAGEFARFKRMKWADITVLITVHDYDVIGKFN